MSITCQNSSGLAIRHNPTAKCYLPAPEITITVFYVEKKNVTSHQTNTKSQKDQLVFPSHLTEPTAKGPSHLYL